MARLRGLDCWHDGDASKSMCGSRIAAGALAALLVTGATAFAPSVSFDADTPIGAAVSPVWAAAADFVFPHSSYQLLTAADLNGCSAYDLYLARNEIFARHGYIFSNADLDAYFRAQPWYVPRYTPDAFTWEWLSSIEMCNIALIQEREELVNTALPNAFDVQTATGRVTTDYFSFAIPQQWRGYVDVTYCDEGGYPRVKVSYRGYPEMVLASVGVCGASLPLAEGDIANGLVSYWDNGRGQRIELWARNYVFLTQQAAQAGSGAYAMVAYPNEFVEAALIDLSTGGAYTVETARLSNQGSGSSDGFDFYRWALASTMWIE